MRNVSIIEDNKVRVFNEPVNDVIDLVVVIDPLGEYTTILGEIITLFKFEDGYIVCFHNCFASNKERAIYTSETFEEISKNYNFQ